MDNLFKLGENFELKEITALLKDKKKGKQIKLVPTPPYLLQLKIMVECKCKVYVNSGDSDGR